MNYENDTVSIDVRNEISNLESLLPLEIVFLDSLLSILGSYTINTNHSSIRFPFCEIVGNLRYVKYKNALGECTSTIVGSNEFSDHILLFGSNQTVFCSDPDSLVQHSSSDEHIPIECSHIDVRWQIYGISRGAACDNDSIAGISIHDNRYRIGPNGFYHSDTITILKIPPRQETLICWGSSLGVQEQIITAEGIYYDTLPNCSCILSYNVTIKDYQSLEVDLSDQFVCPGGEIRVTANDGFANYFWSTGEKTPTIFINEPGAYSLLVESFNDCQMFYDFEIDYLDLYLQQDLCYIGFDTLFGDYSIFFDPLRKIGTVVYVISDIGSGTAVPLDTISVYDEPVFHLANNGPMTLQLATIDACGDYHASVNPS
ncbi:MAG: hypothetical protein KDC53_14705, partial [Saprospiraceae bacterium]|nr:hypothetical protein [Saprospiraceae bacterium]